jgi:hypothetical protein
MGHIPKEYTVLQDNGGEAGSPSSVQSLFDLLPHLWGQRGFKRLRELLGGERLRELLRGWVWLGSLHSPWRRQQENQQVWLDEAARRDADLEADPSKGRPAEGVFRDARARLG